LRDHVLPLTLHAPHLLLHLLWVEPGRPLHDADGLAAKNSSNETAHFGAFGTHARSASKLPNHVRDSSERRAIGREVNPP